MGSGDGARPTLVSLARELGVSRQTVSNALNAPDVVKPETLDRVLAAIRASGYRPSAVGRALRTQRSMTLGYRLYPPVDGINGAVMDRFLHHLVLSAERHGYRLSLFASDSHEDEADDLLALHRAGVIDACVLSSTVAHDPRPGQLTAAGVPTVAFGRPWGDAGATHAWLDIDGAAGCAEAVAWLRAAGHTRIGFLGWPEGSGVGDDRREGWGRAMTGLDTGGLDVARDDAARAGSDAAAELLNAGATAIVCTSDTLAMGALARLRIEGHGGLPVIGFDDTPVAEAIGLSSISQPVEQAARTLIRMALGELQARPPAERQVLLPATLVLRAPERFTAEEPSPKGTP